MLKGLDKDQQSELRENFIHSKPLRKRLIELLEGDINSLHLNMENEDWFETSNWDKVQADRLAQIKALRKVISLLSEKSL